MIDFEAWEHSIQFYCIFLIRIKQTITFNVVRQRHFISLFLYPLLYLRMADVPEGWEERSSRSTGKLCGLIFNQDLITIIFAKLVTSSSIVKPTLVLLLLSKQSTRHFPGKSNKHLFCVFAPCVFGAYCRSILSLALSSVLLVLS